MGPDAQFAPEPQAQGAPQHAQNRRAHQRCERDQQERDGAELPPKKSRRVRLLINLVDALDEEFHDQRSAKNRPRPADRDDLPRAGAALREKIAQHLLAAGRQKASEVGDEREEVSFAAYRGGREAHRDEQSGKGRKKQVEGRSLGDRIAARKYAAESAPQALGRGSHEHRAALYENFRRLVGTFVLALALRRAAN